MKSKLGMAGRAVAAVVAVWVCGGCPGPTERMSPPEAVRPLPAPIPAPAPRPRAVQPPELPPGKAALPATLTPPQLVRPPTLRIWLSDAPAEPEVSCAGPCRVQALPGAAKRFGRFAAAKAEVVAGGLRLGETVYPCTSLELQAEAGGKVRVGNRAYGGAVRLLRGADRVVVINALDMESYLLGVVGGEMPSDWPAEALKAQAVAARTYALYYQLLRSGFEWDLTNTVEDQVYDGGAAKPSLAEAVRGTRGEALLHGGGVFPAFFHSTCGGWTESPGKALGKPEYDFLEGVPCGFCRASPHYEWRARLTEEDLVAKLRQAGMAVGAVTGVSAVAGSEKAGRTVDLVWPGGELAAPIADFRRAVGRMVVLSGKFDCRAQGGEFLFTGHGLGHGAGMCQYGCKGMAEAGRSYREILAYYYRSTTLQKLY